MGASYASANAFLTLGTVDGRALYAVGVAYELHGEHLDRGLRAYPGSADRAAPR
ncbi:hypothetical protein GCM10027605_74360 [Micromonospora zhanjiangensis]